MFGLETVSLCVVDGLDLRLAGLDWAVGAGLGGRMGAGEDEMVMGMEAVVEQDWIFWVPV